MDEIYGFARIDRESTGSYCTFELPIPVLAQEIEEVAEWIRENMPGWDLISLMVGYDDCEMSE